MENFKKISDYLRNKCGRDLHTDCFGHLNLYVKICKEMNCFTIKRKDDDSFYFQISNSNTTIDIPVIVLRYDKMIIGDDIEVKDFVLNCYMQCICKLSEKGV